MLTKAQAQAQMTGPLTAPEPSDETGPGSSLIRPTPTPTEKGLGISSLTRPKDPETMSVQSVASTRSLSTTNPFHNNGSPRPTPKSTPAPSIRELKPGFVERSYPSPPGSTSPRPSGGSPNYRQEMSNGTRPRRSSSLRQRYPGDPSVSPLSQLAKEKAVADRARHITKNHAIRPDTIDSLDGTGVSHYHHEGPYDATLFARNNSWRSSPVAAVKDSNEEALRATPHEKIVDSVNGHRPLDGVAAFPPGTQDRNGQVYKYKEGDNMMTEENAGGGPYKRIPGVQYHPDDIKGKGEPSYTIEKALKDKKLDEKHNGEIGAQGIEMQSDTNRSRSGSTAHRAEAFSVDNDIGLNRSGSLSDKLKKRVGSLRKKKE